MLKLTLPVAVGVIAVALAACSGAGGSETVSATTTAATASKAAGTEARSSEGHAPDGDVELTRCEQDEFGQYPVATLEIVNHSSDRSSYVISVEFVDSTGMRVGEGTAAVNALAHGHAAIQRAYGLPQEDSKIQCRVTKVDRFASL